MKDTIVTAIYHYSYQSRMGGRNYSFEYYENPFRNLLSLNLNMVIFSRAPEIDKIEAFFSKHEYPDYKVVDYDLNNYEFSEKIYALKESQGIIDENGLKEGTLFLLNDRNTHLCLSKMDFLQMAISAEYFHSDHYYWVDAGLFHNGLIPTSLGGMERCLTPNECQFWPQNPVNLCQPALISKLQQENGTDLLFLGLTNPNVQPSWWNQMTNINKNVHIIGGMFGGHKHEVQKLHSMFRKLVKRVLEELNELSLEEDLLTLIVLQEQYHYLKFDTWYHDVPEDSCYYQPPSHQKSFYRLFL